MEIAHSPPAAALGTDNKRHCIRIKARIKIRGETESLDAATEAKPPYQAYCETITSSRPQSPEVFTTPPTHSEPFSPVEVSQTPTYTARITARKASLSSGSTSAVEGACPQEIVAPVALSTSDGNGSKQDVSARRISSRGDAVSKSRYHRASQSITPRGSHFGGTTDSMSRNHTPSLLQVQQANISPEPPTRVVTTPTPLRQKRYGRMNCHPLPPLPFSSSDTLIYAATDKHDLTKTTINFSRGQMVKKSEQQQGQANVLHSARADLDASHSVLPALSHDIILANATAGHERPRSKASRRTVTFADDTTISSRSSSPDRHSQILERPLRQSRSFSSEAQVPSSLRLCRSYDSLLDASIVTEIDTKTHASRRTTPKDFQHRYVFGQRPPPRMSSSSNLGRLCSPHYNPRLSTSKAQYRGLATLPRPLRTSVYVDEPQLGPRRPPWGSLDNLEERREKRIDARERDSAKQFRAATLSEATTLGSTDSFGKEKMKKEVEEYKEQVISVYPDMAFDGSAGKGGRKCCCAVM
ncbi:hypothetical protein OPT61_g7807 [Boeremia exigua]|uniref:Uncharacterized protein n=1 Tax=Boeremia exigua TaxID=749465 RepID=A0ACC2I0U7_9PLEO|nr:hypothetical protein OPT61_g7807 [Boeremia exigua]